MRVQLCVGKPIVPVGVARRGAARRALKVGAKQRRRRGAAARRRRRKHAGETARRAHVVRVKKTQKVARGARNGHVARRCAAAARDERQCADGGGGSGARPALHLVVTTIPTAATWRPRYPRAERVGRAAAHVNQLHAQEGGAVRSARAIARLDAAAAQILSNKAL